MGQDNEARILRIFYDYSERSFTVREITKMSGVPRASTHKVLVNLRKEGLIDSENRANLTLKFKIKKICYFLDELVSIGLIDFLKVELNPSCIILFGAVRKGESNKESDVDLFVESSINKNLNLKKFEEKIEKKIDLFVKSDIKKLNDDLFNNVVNGIKLYGSFKVK